ncbi:reverse transcriptase domain-containing protein [Celeribacter sp.]|uniref:reverse transcriptase domain-containing protein n=1 Tax=Celeribacter sp. TaxID=1890673 RepID=UPI003A910D4C
MLSYTVEKRLESIPDLSVKGKRINGLFRLMESPLLWEAAYAEVASNKGALTRGATENTFDGFSIERMNTIIECIKAGTYRFTPVRRVYIPKANGKSRPLGIPTADDKLVQGVVKLLLERIYEPVFSVRSHGFRKGRSCHTALSEIKDTWTGTKWFVDVDVVGFFDNIDHDVLLGLLQKRIDDKRFIRLVADMLKAGYLEDWKFNPTFSGTPQGGVVSPILANIVLHELDEWLHEKKAGFDKGKLRRTNPEYSRLNTRINAAKRAIAKLTDVERQSRQPVLESQIADLLAQRQTLPYGDQFDPNYRRLLFCRYADDFIIGIVGTKDDAKAIMEEVKCFLLDTLKLTASPEKSKVCKATDGTMFLGYTVKTVVGGRVTRSKTKWGNSVPKRANRDRIRLLVPREKVLAFAARKGYGNLGALKSTHRARLLESSDAEIIMAYNAEMRGFANYYCLGYCFKAGLRKLYLLWLGSLLRTLANKHKSSTTAVAATLRNGDGYAHFFEVGGKRRSVRVFQMKHLVAKTSQDARVDDEEIGSKLYLSRTDVIDRLNARRCEQCGADNVPCEVHHVRHLRDRRGKGEWGTVKAARRRKTRVLCHPCHTALHAGKARKVEDTQAWRAG